MLVLSFLFGVVPGLRAQKSADSLLDAAKNQIFRRLNNFSFSFYVDAYYNMTLNGVQDTSNVVPFSSNCPLQDQIRMNVAAFELGYNSDKVRGKFAIQYGDAPNLLASPMDVANLIDAKVIDADAKAIDAAVAVDDVAMAAAILDEIALLTAPSVMGKGCPHLYKHKASCRFCTPRNFCIHDKRKYICVACGGGAISPHGRRKTTCRFCREAKASA